MASRLAVTLEYTLFLTPSGLRDKAKGERAAWSPGYKFHFSCCRFRLKLEGAGDACLPLRQCVRVVKEMDSKSIGLCPQGFESPRCRPLCIAVRVALRGWLWQHIVRFTPDMRALLGPHAVKGARHPVKTSWLHSCRSSPSVCAEGLGLYSNLGPFSSQCQCRFHA